MTSVTPPKGSSLQISAEIRQSCIECHGEKVHMDELLDAFKEREIEILSLMAEGYSNGEIGAKLFISKETVRWYNKQIYSKLGTSRRTEAIAKGLQLGLLKSAETAVVAPNQTEQKHNLPYLAPPFVGREQDIKQLKELLTDTSHPSIVTLTGTGGMGKTRLAIEAGHQLTSHFNDGVYFVPLDPLRNIEGIAPAILDGLQVRFDPEQKPIDAVYQYCQNRHILLILDNFEHLLEARPFIDTLVKRSSKIKILITSRERLQLSQETAYPLQGLNTEAESLFVASATAASPHYRQKTQDMKTIQRITRLVGGMPLGIILAAAWVDTLTVPEIAAEIENDMGILETTVHDVPERHRNIRMVIQASWHKLTEAEQRACMRLALFQKGFSRQAATQVAHCDLRLLQWLQQKSLIQRSQPSRYTLHPLVRQFALEQLETAVPQQTAAYQAYIAYYQSFLNDAVEAHQHGDLHHALNHIEQEHENILVALDWGLHHPSTAVNEQVSQLLLNLYTFWDARSYATEAEPYLSLGLTLYREENVQLGANLQHKRGRIRIRLGKLQDAEKDLQHARQTAQEIDDQLLYLDCLSELIHVLNTQSRYAEALEYATQYRQKSEAWQSQKHIEIALNRLANVYHYLLRTEDEERVNRQSLMLSRENENDRLTSAQTYNLGLSLLRQNQREEAQQLFIESLALKRLMGDRAGIISRLAQLSKMAVLNGAFAEAKAYLTEASDICQEIHAPRRYAEVLEGWAFYAAQQNEWGEAISYWQRQLAIGKQIQSAALVVNASLQISYGYAEQGLVRQAKQQLRKRIATILEKNLIHLESLALFCLLKYHIAQGEQEQTKRLHEAYTSKSRPLHIWEIGQRDRLLASLNPVTETTSQGAEIRPLLQKWLDNTPE